MYGRSQIWVEYLWHPELLIKAPTYNHFHDYVFLNANSLFLKDCTPWKRPMLEKFVKDCLPWEGPHSGVGKEHEKKGAAETICG